MTEATLKSSDQDVNSKEKQKLVKLVKSPIDNQTDLVYYNGITGINGNTKEI